LFSVRPSEIELPKSKRRSFAVLKDERVEGNEQRFSCFGLAEDPWEVQKKAPDLLSRNGGKKIRGLFYTLQGSVL
jgi:hypothetical protein